MHLKELNEKDVIRVEHFRDTIQQGLNIEEGYNTSSYLKMNIRKMSANIEFYQRERPENLMKLTIEKFLTGLGIFGNKYRYRIYVILFLKKKNNNKRIYCWKKYKRSYGKMDGLYNTNI